MKKQKTDNGKPVSHTDAIRVFFPDSAATCNPDEIKVGCTVKEGDDIADDGKYTLGDVHFTVIAGKVNVVVHPPAVG